jgi:hypothetical protein
MKPPQKIKIQVISLYIDGKSEDEIANMVGLSSDQVQMILSDLNSSESQRILSYLIAIKHGKDGQDAKDYSELIEAKKDLIEMDVQPDDAIPFIVDVVQLSRDTGLGANQFVPAFSIYNKFARSMGIRNYQDLSKRKLQTVLSLQASRSEEKALQDRYRRLTESTVCEDQIDFGVDF